MNAGSAEASQANIVRVLAGLSAVQPPRVSVRLFARTSAGVRGILNLAPAERPSPLRPPASPAAQASAFETTTAGDDALPPAFREDNLQPLSSLRIGDELQVVIQAPVRGYLHLFNLGSSGDVRRMLPRPGETAALLEAGRPSLASPPPSLPWVEKGPANGYPERILAVVTQENRPLPPSLLHPAWNDAAYVRGFGTPIVESLLTAWPSETWAWGLCEAPVAPKD